MSDEKQEIIIVRRSSDGEDGHHGGAWKIAFADFMTAMMALFLVLWLVNAANEETKKAVASYFNPVKLVDRNKSSRGLSDPGGVSNLDKEGTREEPYPEEVQITTPADTPNMGISDSVFFADPDAIIELILSAAAAEVEVTEIDGEKATAAQDSYIDPFAPENWEAAKPQSGSNLYPLEQTEEFDSSQAAQQDAESVIEQPDASDEALASGQTQGDMAAPESNMPDLDAAIAATQVAEQSGPADAGTTGQSVEADTEQKPSNGEKIADSVVAALAAAGLPEESVSIEVRSDSVVVSLMDGDQFEMFGVGSAVPNAKAISAMEALAAPILDAGGKIRIVGHTDGRPYQSGQYDNWKLSSDRALAAFYMLRRAGIGEDNVRALSGKADSALIIAADPYDDRNRRIEVLLEVQQ